MQDQFTIHLQIQLRKQASISNVLERQITDSEKLGYCVDASTVPRSQNTFKRGTYKTTEFTSSFSKEHVDY